MTEHKHYTCDHCDKKLDSDEGYEVQVYSRNSDQRSYRVKIAHLFGHHEAGFCHVLRMDT